MTTLFLHLFSFLILYGAHDLHYSVTNIDYSSKTDTISLAVKINTLDLEFALAHNSNTPLEQSIKENEEEFNKLIFQYITATFSIGINKNEKATLNFVRREISGNDTWVYLSLPYYKNVKNLEIMQALLFDIYMDQINLIIFSENGIEQGFKTTFYNRVIHLKVNSKENEKA